MSSKLVSCSRRSWLKSALLAGVSIWAGENWWLPSLRAQNTEKFPNQTAPATKWGKDSREQIQKVMMPLPTGSKVTDQIFVSRRLENVFYLDLGPHAIVIDSGFHHQVDHHLDNFQRMGCDLDKVVAILGTHFHVDHTGGVKRARERLGVPLIMHPRSVQPVSTGDLLVTAAVIPEVDGWEFEYPACSVDETLDEGDTIVIGEERLEVRHIPGHTPDSLGYLWRGHLFSGDTMFGSGATGWANPRWFSNYSDHAETMKLLLATPPKAETMHASHGAEVPCANTVPQNCLKRLTMLLTKDDDPCNHTPQVKRRSADEPRRVLKLPA